MKPMSMAYPQIDLVAFIQVQTLELVIGHFRINAGCRAISAGLDQFNTDQRAQMLPVFQGYKGIAIG